MTKTAPKVPEPPRRRLVVSIHDVMPETLTETEQLLELLADSRLGSATLLVVPGRKWDTHSLARLRTLFDTGAIPAGHGWSHHVERKRNLYHRVHGALISRNTAEHLALDAGQIVELIGRCHRWFGEHDLPSPDLYVPPAWAMGSLPYRALDDTPFTLFEGLSGVYNAASGRFRRSAMVGFEADTAFRALSCRAWNAVNLGLAGHSRPLRVAIHPHDLSLRLADDLKQLLARGGESLAYTAAAA